MDAPAAKPGWIGAPGQELNLRRRVGVACDADLEAGRLRRRAV